MSDLLGELWGAEELARTAKNTALADLFERAAGAIDDALSLLDNYDQARADRFIAEFSSPSTEIDAGQELSYAEKFKQPYRTESFEFVLRAARFMCDRETARSAEVRAAIGLNNTHSAIFMADMAMRVGGFTRVRGVYRRPANVPHKPRAEGESA